MKGNGVVAKLFFLYVCMNLPYSVPLLKLALSRFEASTCVAVIDTPILDISVQIT